MSQYLKTDSTGETRSSQTASSPDFDRVLVMKVETVFYMEMVIRESVPVEVPKNRSWMARLVAALTPRAQHSTPCLTFCGVIACDELVPGEELLIVTSDQEYRGNVVALEGFCNPREIARKGENAGVCFKAGHHSPSFTSALKNCELYRVPPACMTNVVRLCRDTKTQAEEQ